MKKFLRLSLLFTAILGFFLKASAATVSLAWDANTESDLAGYKIYVGTAPRVYVTNYTVGKVTTLTITNLAYDVTYYFAATAYNTASLESELSNEVNALVPTPLPPTTPGVPAFVSRGFGLGAASFAYSDTKASGFNVYTNGMLALGGVGKSAGSTPTLTIIDLPFMLAGVPYTVQVSAVGTNGLESARSAGAVGRIPTGTTIRRN